MSVGQLADQSRRLVPQCDEPRLQYYYVRVGFCHVHHASANYESKEKVLTPKTLATDVALSANTEPAIFRHSGAL
jgi:hypothetical protein